jgi:hypothetical protein
MRNLFLSFVMLFVTLVVSAQTIDTLTIFSENFDGATHQMTTSTVLNPTGDWFRIDTLYTSYNKSIFSPIYTIDATSSILTTPILSYTSGATNYYLSFKHIAKIHAFDDAYIRVRYSIGNANSTIQWSIWNNISFSSDTPIYYGEGINITGGNFNQSCYDTWVPNDNNAIPTNNWWKSELIDFTSFIDSGDSIYFQIQFICMKSSVATSLGWFIDDIRIFATGENVGIDPSTIETTGLFPNPVQNQLNIKNSSEIKLVEIYSIDGKLIKSVTLNGEKIDVSDLSSGFYIAKLVDHSNRSVQQKFVKQ